MNHGAATKRPDGPPVKKNHNQQPTDPRQQTLDQAAEIERLEALQKLLEERLDNGVIAIDKARAKGKDTQQWEDYWLKLLRRHVEVCNRLTKLAGGAVVERD